MDVNSFITKDYRKNDAFAVQKNKANSKPNKANCQKGKIDEMCVFTKDYERNDIFAVPENKANSNPNKPNQSQFRDNSKGCFSPPQSGDGLVVVYGVSKPDSVV